MKSMNCFSGIAGSVSGGNDDCNILPECIHQVGDDAVGFTDVAKADVLTAKEMVALTMAERDQVYYDIHGIYEKIHESPNLLRERLQQLTEELGICSHENDCYRAALKQNAFYVHNRPFLLRFLRADRFDIKAAARRIVSHFRWKHKLFGDVFLSKDITLEDISLQDLDEINRMPLFSLSASDSAGRPLIIYKGLGATSCLVNFLQKCFLLSMYLSEDEESQRKGIVFLSYMPMENHGCFPNLDMLQQIHEGLGELVDALPIRFNAFHFCGDSVVSRVAASKFKLATCPFQRLRCREHYGSNKLIRRSLQTFGIPMEYIDASIHCFEADDVLCWQKRQRSSLVSVIEQPCQMDVLFGRGSACYSHVGNVKLRMLIEDNVGRYNVSRSLAKTMLTGEIVRQVKLRKGRFLRDFGYGWVEVDDDTARKKVAHAFRTLRGIQGGVTTTR